MLSRQLLRQGHTVVSAENGRAALDVLRATPVDLVLLDMMMPVLDGYGALLEIKNDPEEPDFDPTDSIADQTVATLLDRGEDDRWVISCFRIETIDRCRALTERIRTAWLVMEAPDDVISTLVSRGHSALHPWVAMLRRSHIDVCHGAGIAVNTWTCDDPLRMAELIEWGIDGICTNVPDVAIGVIGGHGAGDG